MFTGAWQSMMKVLEKAFLGLISMTTTQNVMPESAVYSIFPPEISSYWRGSDLAEWSWADMLIVAPWVVPIYLITKAQYSNSQIVK